MPEEAHLTESKPEPVRLGGVPKGQIQRYFCVDDEECNALAMVSNDARIVRRTPKQIWVLGEEVSGWIVEIEVAATDGVVQSGPEEGTRDQG